MSEGADSITQTCENSLTTLKAEEINPEDLPPRTITYTGRRPRFGTGNVPRSPYILIDGKKLRSALALTKKWPPRRVSFPTNDSHLVTGYLEPANPWKLAENVNREDLISAYKESCTRHNTSPLENVISQLEALEISENRSEQLDLKGETLDQNRSEPLEEILKRVQFNKVNLEGTSLDDESSVILFDMLEYYESAKHLNISCNQDIGIRGWQACAHMIKKTQCLEQLEAKDVTLNEQYMNILSRALRLVCHLHVLKLENCGLSGTPIVILVTALKMNTGIRELYLADNGLNFYDAIQLGSLLRLNNHIQLLDISNNNIQDEGVRDILEGLINQVNEDKDGKGLSILVLWNNQLTKKSSPYFSRIIAFSKTLETLNIGKNMLTDEVLLTIKDALKKNRILLQMGMQSTDLTCDGIITLCEIIETNQILQRIDLRDNGIQMTGIKALTTAMKKNKNITQIDLDDKPRMKIDGTLHQYMELVAEIRESCLQNEKNRTLDENTEGSKSAQHHSRFCSASSRKISLTCQTLPCSSPSTTPIQSDESGRSMLEPKRASGGRLRSPAPSPIPSPIASPIPSPSRSRFVVSRVPEASLRSTDSSTSSSPVTPPSLGSSPTRFFPSASGSSRFRVSVVESASTVPSPKSVAASKANVTIGFTFKVDTVESTDSDDSDNVFRSQLGMSPDQNIQNLQDTSSNVSHLVSNVAAKETVIGTAHKSADVEEISTKKCSVEDTSEVSSEDRVDSIPSSEDKECCDVGDNQSNIPLQLESATSAETAVNAENYYNESTKDIEAHVNTNEDNTNSSFTLITDKSSNVSNERDVTKESGSTLLNETGATQPQIKQTSTVQKHTSNLEKLLALFQHPSSLFSDSTCINQLESKSAFQDGVNSVMAFGDKFHNYLKEGRDKVSNHPACPWSSEESTLPVKSKSTKSSNITQLSGLQSLTNMFSSFKLDANLNLFDQSTKSCPKPAESVNNTVKKDSKKDLNDAQEGDRTDVCSSGDTKFNVYIKEKETNVSTLSNRSLPEDVQSKTNHGHTNKDLVLEENCVVSNTAVETCSNKVVSNSTLVNVPESKTTVCIPKLMDIPEYSILEITDDNVKQESVDEIVVKVDSISVEETCDKSLTDSINLTSDSNSSTCNITCDIKIINDVHTVDTLESTHDSVILNLSAKDDAEKSTDLNSYDKPDNVASFVYNKGCDYNVNNISNVCQETTNVDVEQTDCTSNKVTTVPSVENNNDKTNYHYSHNTPSEGIENSDTCHVDDNSYWKSTTVNNTSETGINFISNNSDTEFNSQSIDLHSIVNKEELIDASQKQNALERFITSDNKVFEPANEVHRTPFNEAKNNHCFVDTSMDNIVEKTGDSKPVPAVVLSHHEIPTDTPAKKECSMDYDKSVTEDLIFCMTDISTDGVNVEQELSPGIVSNWPNGNTAKITTPYYALPQTSRSPMNLSTEKPENVHRNSQDSGIGENNLTALDDNIPESMHPHPRENFQESVDSGIESECSSVGIKVDSSIDNSKEEELPMKKILNDAGGDSASENVHEFDDFDSNIVQQHTHCTSLEATNDTTHSYFNTIKYTVVTSACSMAGMNITDATTMGIVSDESAIVITEPTAMIRAASPK